MQCPKCQNKEYVKNGKAKGKQRYKCRSCGCNFTRGDSHGKPEAQKILAVTLHLCGMSMNSIASILMVSTQSVMRWIRWAADKFAPLPEIKSEKVERLEMDEMHHFLLKKTQKLWIWKVLDHDSRKLYAWSYGNRDIETGCKALRHLDGCAVGIVYADSYSAYPDIVGATPLVQSKKNTYQIEQNNSQQRHWLASFHRRSKVVTRSVTMGIVS